MPEAPAPTAPVVVTFPGSSNLVGYRFEPNTGMLEVDFKNGSTYRYQNFTAAQAADWGAAKSAGQWFETNVKRQPDKHPWTAVPKPATIAPPPAQPPAHAAPSSSGPSPVTATAPAPPAGELAVDYQDSHESVRIAAKGAYEAYVKNSGGKSWDGKPCPPFEETGAVRSHWCAAVLDVMGRAGIDATERQSLVIQIEHLKKVARHAEELANTKLEAKVKERTAMLDGEVDALRAQVASAEVRIKAKTFAPWRSGNDT